MSRKWSQIRHFWHGEAVFPLTRRAGAGRGHGGDAGRGRRHHARQAEHRGRERAGENLQPAGHLLEPRRKSQIRGTPKTTFQKTPA